MRGDYYVCKCCKNSWETGRERKCPACCPACSSHDIMNVTWSKRRVEKRSVEAENRKKKEESEKNIKIARMKSIRDWERRTRHSRARFR